MPGRVLEISKIENFNSQLNALYFKARLIKQTFIFFCKYFLDYRVLKNEAPVGGNFQVVIVAADFNLD